MILGIEVFTAQIASAPFTFHYGLQGGHLLLPLAADLVDGFLFGVFRHGGHSFDGLYLSPGLRELGLDGAQLGMGVLQCSCLPLQLLWREVRHEMNDGRREEKCTMWHLCISDFFPYSAQFITEKKLFIYFKRRTSFSVAPQHARVQFKQTV